MKTSAMLFKVCTIFFLPIATMGKKNFLKCNFCKVWLKKDFSFQALRKYWSPIVHYLGISVTFTKKKVFRVSLLVFHTKKTFSKFSWKVGVISWLLFLLIWKKDIFTAKVFTHEKKYHKTTFLSSNFGVEKTIKFRILTEFTLLEPFKNNP